LDAQAAALAGRRGVAGAGAARGEPMISVGKRLARRTGIGARLKRLGERHPALVWWPRVLRLGLFQFAVGLALAPITGTLNRVLIGDLLIPAVAVGFLISLHYFVSPVRAIVGFHTDRRRAVGRWRTPFIVLGLMLTYGGLALAPFALILLGGDGVLSFWPAMAVCSAIFLAYGLGINIVETTFLALVGDITPPRERGRVLAILWMMLVLGTIASSLVMSVLLQRYSHAQLIKVMQGSAVVFVVLAWLALHNQERLKPNGQLAATIEDVPIRATLWQSLRVLARQRALRGLFGVLFIATVAFGTHDVLLEPFGAQVLGMSVAATTQLTAFWGVAMLLAIGLAGVWLRGKRSPLALIAAGCIIGVLGFTLVNMSIPAQSTSIFRGGVWAIGMGRGLFLVGSVTLVMSLADSRHVGLFLGLWGVMQALAQGIGLLGGGLLRDAVGAAGDIAAGYAVVYGLSGALLLVALALLGALRLGRLLRAGTLRSPWAALQDVPGDQLVF